MLATAEVDGVVVAVAVVDAVVAAAVGVAVVAAAVGVAVVAVAASVQLQMDPPLSFSFETASS